MLNRAGPGELPSLVPLAKGWAGHCPPGFLGSLGPHEPLDAWRERAALWLREREHG
jgi:hypothetical protein